MSKPAAPATNDVDELDVRHLPKPQRHPLIFDRFASLAPNASFVLVNSHDPKHLRQEFDRDHPGSYDWHYLETGPVWRIRITRVTSTDVPRILCDARSLAEAGLAGNEPQAAWALDVSHRHLDANIICLPPGAGIESHAGPDLDVLLFIISGAGELATETGVLSLAAGAVVWLPRRSRRSITAAAAGLCYLTVHPRRPALGIATTARGPA